MEKRKRTWVITDARSEVDLHTASCPWCRKNLQIHVVKEPKKTQRICVNKLETVTITATKSKSKSGWTDITAEVVKACGIKPRRKKIPQKKQRAFVPLARRTKHKRMRR